MSLIEAFTHFKRVGTAFKQTVPVDNIRIPPSVIPKDIHPSAKFQTFEKRWYSLPDGAFVPNVDNGAELAKLLYLLNTGVEKLEGQIVSKLIPSIHEEFFDFDEDRGVLTVYEMTGAGREYPIPKEDLGFYDALFDDELLEWETSEAVSEAVRLNDASNTITRSRRITTTEIDPVSYLDRYFSGQFFDPKVPCLVGHTGISKSAIVKASADRHGLRMVDIRCGFIDKSDIEGFMIKKTDRRTSDQAPLNHLIQCTDAFLETAEKFVADHKDSYTSGEMSDEDKDVYEHMVEMAKVPVLFFDEVNRAPKSVRQALTTILSGKSFLDKYTMKRARVVSAANYPVKTPGKTSSDDLEAEEFYTIEDVEDRASLGRFMFLNIDPLSNSLRNNWIKWAEKLRSPSFHSLTLGYLKENTEAAYDLSSLPPSDEAPLPDGEDQKRLTEMGRELSQVKITTYRGWEQVDDYIQKVAVPSGKVDRKAITQILGETNAAFGFIQYIADNSTDLTFTSENRQVDELSEGLSIGMDANVPVLMAGTSSIGKTARAEQVAEARGALLQNVTLSLLDRAQVNGRPVPEASADVLIPPSLSNSKMADEVREALDSEIRKGNLPEQMTTFYPSDALVSKFQKAADEGREVILFFDEVNRCEPVIMSAVFEAVSDNRFMGVQFPPGRLKVICACNIGELYDDVNIMGAAFMARFMVISKPTFDKTDRDSFIHWANSQTFTVGLEMEDGSSKLVKVHAIDEEDAKKRAKRRGVKSVKSAVGDGQTNLDSSLAGALEQLSIESFLEITNSLEDLSMGVNVPSFRGLQSASNQIRGASSANWFMRGKILSDTDDWMGISEKDLREALKDSRWCGRSGSLSDSTINVANEGEDEDIWNGEDVLETAIAQLDRGQLYDAKELIERYDAAVHAERVRFFAPMGNLDVVEEILENYNTLEQDGRFLTIEDLRDSSLIKAYLDQQLISSVGRNTSSDQEEGLRLASQVDAILTRYAVGDPRDYSDMDILTLFESVYLSASSESSILAAFEILLRDHTPLMSSINAEGLWDRLNAVFDKPKEVDIR